ncbi:MAG: potassium channel family protein [Cellulosilyticaceae bacterium]
MAFLKDAFDKLNPAKREENGLKYHERIQLALRSYAELIINYALLYYILDQSIGRLFNRPMRTLIDSIYFSAITIATIGYGDYYPIHNLSKILVMYEVISGTLLLVVSFTVYVNLGLKD